MEFRWYSRCVTGSSTHNQPLLSPETRKSPRKINLQIEYRNENSAGVKFGCIRLDFVAFADIDSTVSRIRAYCCTCSCLQKPVRYSNFPYETGPVCQRLACRTHEKPRLDSLDSPLPPLTDWIRTGPISWPRLAALFSLDKGQGIPFEAAVPRWQRRLMDALYVRRNITGGFYGNRAVSKRRSLVDVTDARRIQSVACCRGPSRRVSFNFFTFVSV